MTHKKISNSIIATLVALFALVSFSVHAQDTPVGLWKTIDDVSGKPKSLVRITENNGVLSGKIEKLFRAANEDQNPLCTKCEGVNKDQPILGMVILVGLKKEGDEYTGGTILDPDNGKHYKSRLILENDAKKLNVRGYIGVPMFGRSQTWLREE